jgi:hypothetical protein
MLECRDFVWVLGVGEPSFTTFHEKHSVQEEHMTGAPGPGHADYLGTPSSIQVAAELVSSRCPSSFIISHHEPPFTYSTTTLCGRI